MSTFQIQTCAHPDGRLVIDLMGKVGTHSLTDRQIDFDHVDGSHIRLSRHLEESTHR